MIAIHMGRPSALVPMRTILMRSDSIELSPVIDHLGVVDEKVVVADVVAELRAWRSDCLARSPALRLRRSEGDEQTEQRQNESRASHQFWVSGWTGRDALGE